MIEVVSKDSVRRDRQEKFLEYEAAGIPEYWIIDPRPGFQRADFYELAEGAYRPLPVVDGVLRSPALPGFWLRTEWLFDEAARAIDAIREILGDRAP